MPIDVTRDTLIRFRDLPSWSKEHFGKRIHPSTFQRWRLRGVRGVKLASILVGGERYSSEESLQTFFAATTAAADGQPVESYVIADKRQDAADAAFLASHGI
jgi:Protein of unknown function (DUF1580)